MIRRIVSSIPVLFAAFLIFCIFSVMNQEKSSSGIENYTPAYCSLGLTDNLFPCDDFPVPYEYAEADYHYYYHAH